MMEALISRHFFGLYTGKRAALSNCKIVYFSLIKPRSKPVISNLAIHPSLLTIRKRVHQTTV